jgi:hypothetical protein
MIVLMDMANNGELVAFNTKEQANLWDKVDYMVDNMYTARGATTTFNDVTDALTEAQLVEAEKYVIGDKFMEKIAKLYESREGDKDYPDAIVYADEVYGEFNFEIDGFDY